MEQPFPTEASPSAPLTAVVVDDSKTSRTVLKLYLAEVGYVVVGEGVSGDQAMELYERHRPTLMTLDIVLPGKDGVTAATELLQKHPSATVVMCSSITARDKILACRDAGVRSFILKPFTAEKVQEIAKSIASQVQAVGGAR